MFLIVFDHANACASMNSLVEIHNTRIYYSHGQFNGQINGLSAGKFFMVEASDHVLP